MAIVFSQKVNTNIPEDQLYTRSNYYTGASFQYCAPLEIGLTFCGGVRIRDILGRSDCWILQPAVRYLGRSDRIERCVGRCGGPNFVREGANRGDFRLYHGPVRINWYVSRLVYEFLL